MNTEVESAHVSRGVSRDLAMGGVLGTVTYHPAARSPRGSIGGDEKVCAGDET